MKRPILFSVLLPLALLLASCGEHSRDPLGPEVRGPSQELGPNQEPSSSEEIGASSPEVQTIPGDWIVVFRPGVPDPPGLARRLVDAAGGRLRFTYEHTIQGFAATLPTQALSGIRNNPNVARIEPDAVVTAVDVVPAASWGLDRIDQRDLPLSGTYEYDSQGAGVDAYIIDTGIRVTHTEFGGRASRSAEADFLGGEGDDCHGHGTHVAGIVGGAHYGVASAVNLYAVRVLDCDGSGAISGVIAGVDWVTARRQGQENPRPAVANMSLAAWDPFGVMHALNDAVAASVDAGVVYAVAAANDNRDACQYTPASEPQALTVGATGSTDQRASFSNYGYCLDLFAPGVAITSAFNTGDDALQTWSGTSMASPHVAGVAALYLGENPDANPTTVKFHIQTKATEGVVSDPGIGSPNKLLYSLITRDEPQPPPPAEPPPAPSDLTAVTASTSRIDLSWTDNATDEDAFEVERSPDGSSFDLVATLGPDAQGFSDTGLTAGTPYWYRVRATNSAGPSGYSNVAQATTATEPPPPETVTAEVWEISDVDVTQSGKFLFGTVLVAVTEAGDPFTQLPGVTVTGDWYLDGEASPVRSSSGTTGTLGEVFLSSGRIKGSASTGLHFCVTSLSGSEITDGTTYPRCSPGFTPPDPGTPPEPPAPGVPSGLLASWSSKGGGRVELTWTPGGGAEVDVFRNSVLIATTADNGRFNDRDGQTTSVYELCIPGGLPGDPNLCTGEAPVGG